MNRTPRPIAVLTSWVLALAFSPSAITAAPSLLDEIEGLLDTIAVTGRELPAEHYLRGRMPRLPVATDRMGNLTVTIGSGVPRRLVACPIDEPGFAVSDIRGDGYLRLRPLGRLFGGRLWAQMHEGQKVMVQTADGPRWGAVAVRSIHLEQAAADPDDPIFTVDDAFVDVGAESAEEARSLGIRLLDPVALERRSVRLLGNTIAGPSAATKAACVTQAAAARDLHANGTATGTTVFAWTVADTLNGHGLLHVERNHGPFDRVVLVSRTLGWRTGEDGLEPTAMPAPGAGLLVDEAGEELVPRARVIGRFEGSTAFFYDTPWDETTRVAHVGLPHRFGGTPVETIAAADAEALRTAMLTFAGLWRNARRAPAPAFYDLKVMDEPPIHAHHPAAVRLASLVAAHGVSGDEAEIRDAVRSQLPRWARPQVDDAGNLTVTFGHTGFARDAEHVVFVAHLDEVGFRIEALEDDGRLRLARVGGLFPSLWEGQAARIHTGGVRQDGRTAVPAVFAPREAWRDAERRSPGGPLMLHTGATSANANRRLGIAVGDTVTMPKGMRRMGRHRAVARSFDDRVGSAALVEVLHRIEPEKLRHRYTFAWVTEEEIGLHGSLALAARDKSIDRVHPVDTFVSSDDPFGPRGFARTPLGQGAVLRAMDNAFLARAPVIAHARALATSKGIPLQIGFTGGSNDGVAFLPDGVAMLPLSWPGRYSHSPVEIVDLRDLDSLIALITALVEEPSR